MRTFILEDEDALKQRDKAYTGTSKGTTLAIVYQMGMVIVCGDVDSNDERLVELKLWADSLAKDWDIVERAASTCEKI
jgi:hypothetical protein